MKHLLKIADLSESEIIDILNLADQLKYEKKHGIPHRHLEGKTLGMIFQKSSTRTRVSFEVGMCELGGNAVVLSVGELQMGRGEPIQDTARVLSRYLDGIMIRTYDQKDLEDLVQYGSIPIINGLTDYAHPCQVLADLMTIREYKDSFKGLKVGFIGDGFNMANSLAFGCVKVGSQFVLASPKEYQIKDDVLEQLKPYGDLFSMTEDVMEAAKDADVLITDVWASLGQESETQKRRVAFKGYQINDDVLAAAKPDVMIQHCLPAHREEEITTKIFEDHAAEIFDEAENRIHAQKAVLVKLLGKKAE
ncbi:MAG: ornithine carbamoyltransferase [Fusobacteriaceae bacterium]|jgi:ornithine carbamoyltransferase|nr:ornithine carbamoyltransferase [Fusobacteriaceae bacterium]